MGATTRPGGAKRMPHFSRALDTIELIMVLPGKIAKEFRLKFVDIIDNLGALTD